MDLALALAPVAPIGQGGAAPGTPAAPAAMEGAFADALARSLETGGEGPAGEAVPGPEASPAAVPVPSLVSTSLPGIVALPDAATSAIPPNAAPAPAPANLVADPAAAPEAGLPAPLPAGPSPAPSGPVQPEEATEPAPPPPEPDEGTNGAPEPAPAPTTPPRRTAEPLASGARPHPADDEPTGPVDQLPTILPMPAAPASPPAQPPPPATTPPAAQATSEPAPAGLTRPQSRPAPVTADPGAPRDIAAEADAAPPKPHAEAVERALPAHGRAAEPARPDASPLPPAWQPSAPPPAEAPPPPAPAMAPPPPLPPRQVASVAIALAFQPGDASGFTLALEPPELGRVEIEVRREGDVHTVRIAAERPETLALLQRDHLEMDRSLADAGLKLTPGGIDFSLGTQGEPGARDEPRQGGSSPMRQDRAERASPLPEPPRLSRSLLDLHI